MKKMMKLNIAICDDNKLVLDNEKTLIEETLKEMGIPYKMDKYQNPENLIKILKILSKMHGNTI